MGALTRPGARPRETTLHEDASSAGIRLPGVEEPLPPGERVLWQGRPGLWPTALRVLHLRAILLYWGIVALGFLVWGAAGGPSAGSLASDLAWLALVALVGTGVVLGLARLIQTTSLYVVTDRRVVMRVGITLPGVLNLPHEQIGAVDLRTDRDGSGDLVLTPSGDERVGWLFLWPHVRPWTWKDPIPALRAVPDVGEVGALVADLVKGAAPRSAPVQGRGDPSLREAVS